MKTFLIVKVQRGEGCDYTIGCGTKVDVIEALTEQEALLQAINCSPDWKDEVDNIASVDDTFGSIKGGLSDWLSDLPNFTGEYSLESLNVYEVKKALSARPLLEEVHAYINSLSEKMEASQQEVDERAEYLRLKKKFER